MKDKIINSFSNELKELVDNIIIKDQKVFVTLKAENSNQAKKLENFGNIFLVVINGEVDHVHPRRRKLAGAQEGELYDLLVEVQSKLSRGAIGVDKPLSCSASLLSKIAKLKPRSLNEMSKIIGPQKTDRFGAAFLDILADVT